MSGSRSDKRVDRDRLVGYDEPMKKRAGVQAIAQQQEFLFSDMVKLLLSNPNQGWFKFEVLLQKSWQNHAVIKVVTSAHSSDIHRFDKYL